MSGVSPRRLSVPNNTFIDKLTTIAGERDSRIILKLNPQIEKLPIPIARYDDPFLPFGKEIIRATSDLVCGYLFDLSSYLALGAAGVVALERTIRYVPAGLVRILHGPFWGPNYVPMMSELALGLDAVTLIRESDAAFYPGAVLIEDIAHYPAIYQEGRIQIRSVGDIMNFAVSDDGILYAGKLDDYAAIVRATIQQREWE
jgi:hypothetical protein